MYKRIFFSKTTAVVATICIVFLSIGSFIIGNMAVQTNWYDYFDISVKILLASFLFFGYIKHNMLAMQAGCSGLLLCMIYYQAGYVLDELFSRNAESFIILGFWGSFFLAGELMLLVLEVIIAINHFVINILKKQNFIRVAVNQATIIILFVFLALQLFINTKLLFEPITLLYFGISHLNIVAIYVLIACSELILTIDAAEGGN